MGLAALLDMPVIEDVLAGRLVPLAAAAAEGRALLVARAAEPLGVMIARPAAAIFSACFLLATLGALAEVLDKLSTLFSGAFTRVT